MRWSFAFLILLAGCRDAVPEPAAARPDAIAVASPCRSTMFEGSRFTVCSAKGFRLSLAVARRDGMPFRRFAALEQAMGARAIRVGFAMNAGMFGKDGLPIGLAIAEHRQWHPLNRRDGGGNFHLKPNGVFLVRDDDQAAIVASEKYRPGSNIRVATQSGPMLVIDGQLHPKFDADGQSRFVRNGVGIGADGTALFAISEEAVSFGKFARLFRDGLGCRNALYFDGSVSSLWDPANERRDDVAPLGPMIVATRDL